ncbi:MAG: hypothetical protein HY874_07705 [Chloroflexi bacterium]|nr:hypothetical protein [Chloroflexota bacterium]
MEIWGIILGVAGIGLAVAVPVCLLWLEKPRLEIMPASWQPQGVVLWWFAVLRVRNKPLPRWMRAVLRRDIAPRCSVTAEFLGAPFAVIDLRWSAAGNGMPPASQELLAQSKELDLAPSDDGQEIAMAILHQDGTANAYSAESYTLPPPWADPRLLLTQQTYLVKVVARSAGEEKEALFELPYLGPNFNQFATRAKR